MKKGTIIGLLAGLLLNEEKLTPINMAVATTAGGMAASSLSEAATAPDTKETITTTLLYCSVPSEARGFAPGDRVYVRNSESQVFNQKEVFVKGTVPGASMRVIVGCDDELLNVHELFLDRTRISEPPEPDWMDGPSPKPVPWPSVGRNPNLN